MKYTICGFNQEKMCSLGMDLKEAQILRWFVDFYTTDSMCKITINNQEYVWIKYKAIIDDLPMLRINTIRTLVRIFDHFVEIKLMQKYIKKDREGTFTYFHINSVMLKDLLSSTKKQPQNIKKEDSISTTGQKCPVQKSRHPTHRTKMSCAKKDTTLPTRQNCPVLNPLSDNHPTKMSSGHTSELSSAHPTKLSTQTISLLENSSTTATSQLETVILRSLKKLFGSSDIFSQDFIPELLQALTNTLASTDWDKYLSWVYTNSQNADNISAYFYKIATKQYSIAKFTAQNSINKNTGIQQDKSLFTCPICGHIHNQFISCPICGLGIDVRDDIKQLNLQKKIYLLPDEKKEALDTEITNFMIQEMAKPNWFLPQNQINYKEKENSIYKKYIVNY